MGITENSKSVVDKKDIKQRTVAQSENKYFVRKHDKIVENILDTC